MVGFYKRSARYNILMKELKDNANVYSVEREQAIQKLLDWDKHIMEHLNPIEMYDKKTKYVGADTTPWAQIEQYIRTLPDNDLNLSEAKKRVEDAFDADEGDITAFIEFARNERSEETKKALDYLREFFMERWLSSVELLESIYCNKSHTLLITHLPTLDQSRFAHATHIEAADSSLDFDRTQMRDIQARRGIGGRGPLEQHSVFKTSGRKLGSTTSESQPMSPAELRAKRLETLEAAKASSASLSK